MYSILFINMFVFFRLYYIYQARKHCGSTPQKNKYFIGAGLSVVLSVLLFLLIGDYLVIPGITAVLVFAFIERKILKKAMKEEGRKQN